MSRMEFDGSNLIRISDQQTRVSEAKHPMTLHCQQCNTVLGDSQSVCGEISCLDSIMCLSKFISRITTASLFRNSLNRAATRKCKSSHERCAACKFHDSAFRNKYNLQPSHHTHTSGREKKNHVMNDQTKHFSCLLLCFQLLFIIISFQSLIIVYSLHCFRGDQ